MSSIPSPKLEWSKAGKNYDKAILGTEEDGVLFELTFHPTCHRRGPFKLLIEVLSGPNHHKWGCFDDQDQPMRWYHCPKAALGEAQRIADILWVERYHPDKRMVIFEGKVLLSDGHPVPTEVSID